MTDFAHLVTSKVNIGLIQEMACNELLNILDRCEGTKVKRLKSTRGRKNFFYQFLTLGSDVG